MTRLSRREFLALVGAAGAAATIAVPLGVGFRGSSSTGWLLPSHLPLPLSFTRPLPVAETLAPTRSGPLEDVYDLVQRAGTAEILPGVSTPIWGYNGQFPGPTIRSRRGQITRVRHLNRLPVPTVVHLHGGHTPAEHDGYPTDLVVPAGSPTGYGSGGGISLGNRDYIYPMDQRAATLWYHDHRMGFTGATVWRGLAGFHLVSDDEEDRLPLPRDDRDLPLLIADRSFSSDGSLAYPSLDPTLLHEPGVQSAFAAGVLGDVVTVNGVAWPYAELPRARHRLRLLNGSNARRYRLALTPPPAGGGGLVQIGTDGGLLDRPIAHDALELAPAQRFDVIVDFTRYPPGSTITLTNDYGDGPTRNVLQFRLTHTTPDDSAIPDRLSTVEPLPTTGAVIRNFTFTQGNVQPRPGMPSMPGWLINGEAFDPDQCDTYPTLGQTEIRHLTSDLHHPVHLHLSHFQVLGRGINGPGPYDHGWKDTVDLRPAEDISIAVRFDTYTGRYLLHCHNLEHEDMAMMANFTPVA